ncbi:hypothetical protein TVAG_016630 [Trichomonas vaginalis G3]|uniref:PCI domain-containing protein n=1 Tax=Trichomonas vaginalis (strain ATCC PRA-98 / G3) TaxID=412133 RepID=A2ER01_TRIV3|nr:COP9 signalosome complex subunit 7/dendritic cell protein GA17 family [Trichomonas vaginalis G3]EAY04891.1 hypothetical protein TVAG_016630 [Trichomonas vaginalis G3]KAI5519451.1 COP9 signalosome complex subunit 7/dendritic cell protein GA17 family [Trichomonas vaginalis G3]|eukprot:XP_001317114.1 hypothetical protein [Trichomonas vaginalis G3]
MNHSQLIELLNDETTIFFYDHLQKFPADSIEHKLLDVFTFGVWNDYLDLEKDLPADLKLKPNSRAAQKLKCLTITSFFLNNIKGRYETLKEVIGAKDEEEVENIAIMAQGFGLVRIQIDQNASEIDCLRVSSRCIRNTPEDLDKVIGNIRDMKLRIKEVTN